jgi:hypothetical protein
MADRLPKVFNAAGVYDQELPVGDNLDVGGGKLVNLGTPTAATDGATKAYVDAVATGLDWKASVRLATAAALPANTPAGSGVGKTLTATANGALSVDGVAVAVNDRILVKNEVAGANNGIYTVTAVGDGSNPYVLTRATDFDTNAEVTAGAAVFSTEGSTNADRGWVLTTDDPIVVDTTALAFAQFSAATAYTFGAGLLESGSTVSVELDTAANAQGAGSGGGSSGLEFDTAGNSGKLRAAVHATGGVERTATGLAAKLNGNSLASGASGLSVQWAPHLRFAFVADETLAVGDPVYQTTTNNRFGKGRADTDSKANVRGIAATAAAAGGDAVDILMMGVATGILSGATAGTRYYLAPTGGLTTTQPGSNQRIIEIGYAINATDLLVFIIDRGKKA